MLIMERMNRMSKVIVDQLQRVEGNLRVVQDENNGDVWLESDQSLFVVSLLWSFHLR